MANVVKWGYNTQFIVFNPKLKNDKWRFFHDYTVWVDTAILDADVQCMHCGKTVKSGKLVFVFIDASTCILPSSMSKEGWGNERSKRTFCSSSHAKLFAKNTK